jgi:peptidase M1-like protein
MKCKQLIFIIVTMMSSALIAQKTTDLFIPTEIQNAYKSDTRSESGKPGPHYYQNKTDYNIIAEFFPKTNELTGKEIITFKNNSPDTLNYIYLSLYQNIFKRGESRDSDIDPRNIHDGVDILEVIINDTNVDTDKLYTISTLLIIPVENKILPDSESEIEISWKQKMPKTPLFRIGTYYDTNYFIGYWYPKINVYDDIVGWNTTGFKGNAEFYNEFGDYNVEITVPQEYQIWSSGLLQNMNEIYDDKIVDRILLASLSDEVVSVIDTSDRINNNITKNKEQHTWKFKAENLPDFAFAVSSTYLWDATSVESGDGRILVNSIYNHKSANFESVAQITRQSVEYLSDIAPEIPYPYPQITVFNGQKNGMEFPGIVNNQNENNDPATILITAHEVAHAYFPFNVGINEQKYGWMDEGIISLLSIIMLSDFMGDTNYNFLGEVAKRYRQQAGKLAIDVPPMICSHNAGDFTYGYITYVRPITALYLLYDYLGKDKYYNAIREFTTRWEGKHPTPYDLFYTINEVAGENLNWFWKPWFFEFGYADVGIEGVENNLNGSTIHFRNIGGFPVPIDATIIYSNGDTLSTIREINIWNNGSFDYMLEVDGGEIDKVILNTIFTPDANISNNLFTSKNNTNK